MAWIEQALLPRGQASVRRRRLSAEQVVWLVIALALYRHQSIPDLAGDARPGTRHYRLRGPSL
nr:transposase domain-containing protein [Cupriavidus oxalaticus]